MTPRPCTAGPAACARVGRGSRVYAHGAAGSYDADGLPVQVGDLAMTRDVGNASFPGGIGVLTATSMGSGAGQVTTSLRYTAFGELRSLASTRGSSAGLSCSYTFDALGRLKTVTETEPGAATRLRCYTYDAAGRLSKVYSAADMALAACTGSVITTYGYDANGNRVSSVGSETVATSGAAVDAQDRLTTLTLGGASDATTFAYTAGGMLRTRSVGAMTTASYGYDAHGALTGVQLAGGDAVSYRNDPMGRRVRRTHASEATRRWLWDGLRVRREVVEGSGGGPSTTRTFVYGTRGHTPDYLVQDGVRYRVISDHLGSVRRVVRTSDGVVVQAMDYDAWGRVLRDEALDASGALVAVGAGNVWQPLPQGYAGGLYDRATGLVRFGARDYDSVLGRWMQKDPIGFEGGDSGLYSYCGGNPVQMIDPNGTDALDTFTDFSAGFGDALLLGTPILMRRALGIDGVNMSSSACSSGVVAGTAALLIAFKARGLTRAALLARAAAAELVAPEILALECGSGTVGNTNAITGAIRVVSGMSESDTALTALHEAVHSTFVPRIAALSTRVVLADRALYSSHLVRGLSEGLAEGLATGSLRAGVNYAVGVAEVSAARFVLESVIYGASVVGIYGYAATRE